MRSSPPPLLDPGQFLRQRDRFLTMRGTGKLSHRGVEVARELIRRSRMLKRRT